MQPGNFDEAIDRILQKDSRYPKSAYQFMREALDFTSRMLRKPGNGPGRHVSGQELIEGIRVFALQEYGPLAWRVLRNWGITRTEDFGEIVFNLVETSVLGKTSEDSREDFASGYDFDEVFRKPYLPAPAAGRRGRGRRGVTRRAETQGH